MKKIKFRFEDIIVERNKRKIKVLETPTFLKRLYFYGKIDLDTYTEKNQIYSKAIKLKENLPTIEPSNELQLRNYQQQIVEYAKNFRSFAIFDEPRLGKTPTVLKLLEAKELLEKKIVIAAPSKVIANWIREAKRWINIEAIKYEGESLKNKKSGILVMTYERVRLSLNELEKWKPDVFILDEAHVLRNSKGTRQRLTASQQQIREETGLLPRNQSILKLAKIVNHRYPLSGTPSVNSAEDIFAILQFQMPNIFNSYWNFVYYYFNVNVNFWGAREITGYHSDEKEKEFQELLNYVSSNNKQEEHLKWMKDPKITTTYIKLNEEQQKHEKTLIEEARIDFHFILNTLESYTHYNTLVINPSLLPMIDLNNIGAKNEYLIEQLKLHKEENVAIFSTREKNVFSLHKAIKEQTELRGRTIYVITGKTKAEESLFIQEQVNKLNKNRGIIVLGTIAACKEGISLQGLTKAYITDQSWVSTDMEQLFKRLNATSPENQNYFGEKTIEKLHVKDSIDDIIEDTLVNKKSNTEMVNDYKKFIEERKRRKDGKI